MVRHLLKVCVIGVSLVLFSATSRAATEERVVAVSITGNVHIAARDILKVVLTRVGQPYSLKTVYKDFQRIDNLGVFSKVSARVYNEPNGIAVTYVVAENPVVRSIRFEGNALIPSSVLLNLIDVPLGQVLNSQRLVEQSFINVDEYYTHDLGYQIPEVHVRTYRLDPNDGTLVIPILEGYKVAHLIIDEEPQVGGRPLIPVNDFLQVIQLKPGTVWSEKLMSVDIKALESVYGKSDVALAAVETEITNENPEAGTLDLTYHIDAVQVTGVEFRGNAKTKNWVIERLLRERKGSVARSSLKEQDQERLLSSGLFSSAHQSLMASCGSLSHEVAIQGRCYTVDWDLTERNTASFHTDLNYSGGLVGFGPYATGEFRDVDFAGLGATLRVNADYGPMIQQGDVSLLLAPIHFDLFDATYTHFFPLYNAETVTMTSKPKVTDVTPLFVSSQQQLSGEWSTNTISTYGIRAGGDVRVGSATSAFMTVSSERDSVSSGLPPGYAFFDPEPKAGIGDGTLGLAASSVATFATPKYMLNTASLGLRVDTTTQDKAGNSRAGVAAEVQQLYSTSGLGSSVNFEQTDADVRAFVPLLGDDTAALHLQGRASAGTIPANNLFTFSDQQLRGYNAALWGTNTALAQLELRLPLARLDAPSMVLFVDSGGVALHGAVPLVASNGQSTLFPNNWHWHSDYGIGLRIPAKIVGIKTVRLDAAEGTHGLHFSLGLGQSF